MVADPHYKNPLIKMEDGAFSFGQTLIFQQVNLQVSKGEICCLLCPNGCGKTTLIDCIPGIHRLDRGEFF